MPEQILTITLAKERPSNAGGTLFIEQESLDPYLGHLTKIAALQWLNKILFGADEPASNCPEDGPGYNKAVYVFPSPENLNYKTYCSNGTYVGPLREEILFEELVQCDGESDPTLKYPATSIISWEWQTETYNTAGEVVAKPRITVKNNTLKFSKKVWGTVKVIYMINRHTYVLSIYPRMEYEENKIQSYFLAVWDGGTSYIEVEAPATAEDGECNNRWNPGTGAYDYVSAIPASTSEIVNNESGDDPYGPVPAEDETVYIDYCSQTEL